MNRFVAVPPRNGYRRELRRAHIAAVYSGQHAISAYRGFQDGLRAQEMRKLTLHLRICSAMPIVTGVERDFVDSGEVL
jgi:hypothetical protein